MATLPETLHPGIFPVEQEGQPRVPGVGVTTGGFVGPSERGRSDLALLVTNFQQFVTEFGNALATSYLYDAVRGFFQQGGTRCYVCRVVGAGAAAASVTVEDNEPGAEVTLTFSHKGEGAFGNTFTMRTDKFRTTLSVDIPAAPSTSATLTSVAGLEVGDAAILEDGVTRVDVIVHTINPTTKVITFASVTPGGIISAATSIVRTSTQHRMSTRLTAILSTGDTFALVETALSARVGQRLVVTDGTTTGTAVVQATSGNQIIFTAPIVLSAPIAVAEPLVSMEFGVQFFESGSLSEQHDFMSMEAANLQDYAVIRIDADSRLFSVVDGAATVTNPWDNLPDPLNSKPMTGGLDGTAPTPSEVLGSSVAPKSGVFCFDPIEDIQMVSAPGFTDQIVSQGLVDYAEARQNLVAILETPLASDEPVEARDYRLNTLARDSSFGALYYPWIKIDSPITPGLLRDIPPTGHVQGAWSAVAASRGIQKAPANVVLAGALALTFEASDADQDILNPIGVNAIRLFSGEGIKIFGARTLSNLQDGRQYIPARRILIFVRESLRLFLRNFLFEPIDPLTLYGKIQNAIEDFLLDQWRARRFFPSNDRSRAFFVKVDEENNTDTDRAAGRVIVDVGINPPPPAEFIILRVSLFDGGARFEETLAGIG